MISEAASRLEPKIVVLISTDDAARDLDELEAEIPTAIYGQGELKM